MGYQSSDRRSSSTAESSSMHPRAPGWCRRALLVILSALSILLFVLHFSNSPSPPASAMGMAVGEAAGDELVDTTTADFASGARTNVSITETGDGELTIGEEEAFSVDAYRPYERFGIYISDVKTGSSGFNQVTVSWDVETPEHARLDLEVRISADGRSWSEWQPAQAGSPIQLAGEVRHAQYRATFLAMSGAAGPVLSEVRLAFSAEPIPSGQGLRLQSETGATYRLYATREGLVGYTTANGHVIQPRDRFVALPSRRALCSKDGHEYEVLLSYNGREVRAPVWDVGPWNIHDNYWDETRDIYSYLPLGLPKLPLGMPESQAAFESGYNGGKDEFGRTVLNRAGIDLADGTFWDDLGMWTNDWVYVTFLWKQPPPALPSGTVSIEDGAAVAHRPGVTLYLTYSNASEVRFRNENTSIWSSWAPVSPTKTWTLSTGNGQKTVYAQYRSSGGLLSSETSDSIWLDYTRPTGSITANGGATTTSVITVTLSLSAYDPDGIKGMKLGNLNPDGVVEWTSWMPLQSTYSWRLHDGPDGPRTVSVRYRDVWNNSSIRYDYKIELLRQAPALVRPLDDLVANKLTPRLDWTDVPDAKRYLVVVKDRVTGRIVHRKETTVSEYWLPLDVLKPSGKYIWWTKAKTYGWWSAKSAEGRFSVSSFQPVLLSPASGTVVDTAPLLDWKDVLNAKKYRLVVKNKLTGAIIINNYNIVDSQYQVPPGVLKAGRQYEWKVIAKIHVYWGTPSAKWSFATY